MARRSIPRSKVDGTEPGVAMLVIVNLNESLEDTPRFIDQVFVEDRFPNPGEAAHALWRSTQDDFPDCDHAVVLNERAKYLMARDRTQAMGIEYPVETYLETS